MSNDEMTPNEVQAEDLTDELAKKYDPERLLRMVSKRAGRGDPLDPTTRAKYEKRFGVDLGHVRIITGEFAEEFNRKREAYAVTVGGTGMILMGNSPDKSMGSAAGQALLAHELTHVAQARRGLFNASIDRPLATEENEGEAEDFETKVMAAGGDVDRVDTTGDSRGAADASSAKVKNKEKLAEQIEKIKARVLDMAADSYRTHVMRNNVARRP